MFGLKKKVYSVGTGICQSITQAKDPVFREKMMGEGFLLMPSSGEVYAPVSGKIQTIFPTLHAISIELVDGSVVLIHMGIETVSLKGQGFEVAVVQGTEVKANSLLAKMDLQYIESQGLNTDIMVVFPESNRTIVNLKTDIVKHAEVIGLLK